MMNDDDAPTPQMMIQSSQQVWSAAELPNLSESNLAGGLWGVATRARTVRGWALAKPETAAHRAWLDTLLKKFAKFSKKN